MKIMAVNDYYDLVLTDDNGSLLDAETFEQTDDIRDAYVARGIADEDPEEWERKAREACADAGFKAGALIEDGTEKRFEAGNDRRED